jgi:hypothetical protein
VGDFNPNAPTIMGTEFFPIASRVVDLGANPLKGVAQRFSNGAATPSPNWVELYAKNASNSLAGAEIVTGFPQQTVGEIILPGTETGKTAAVTWVDETGAANNFAKVAKTDTDDTTYLTIPGVIGTGATQLPFALGATNAIGALALMYRGNRAATYAAGSNRPVSVTINARIASTYATDFFQFCIGTGTAATQFIILSGSFNPPGDGVFRNYSYTIPGDPWDMASNNIANSYYRIPPLQKTWDDIVTTTGAYGFGINVRDKIGNTAGVNQFRVSGLWLTVNYALATSRKYYAFPAAPLKSGWNRIPLLGSNQRPINFTSSNVTTALTTPAMGALGAGNFSQIDVGATIRRASDNSLVGTVTSVTNSTTAVLVANGATLNTNVAGIFGTAAAAMVANTYYFLVQSMVAWTTKSRAQITLLQDPNVINSTVASAAQEHRRCYDVQFKTPGDFVPSVSNVTVGEMTAWALDIQATGTGAASADTDLQTQSFPFTELKAVQNLVTPANNSISTGVSCAQAVTGAAATTYSAVRVSLGRYAVNLDPDQPITVEVRHGAGASTGTGTLDAICTLYPSQLKVSSDPHKPTIITQKFDLGATFLSILNQQYFIFFRSASTATRGWAVLQQDTRSDAINGVLTASNITNASVGTPATTVAKGNIDQYVDSSGAATNRQDVAVALLVQPATPASPTATVQVAT